DALLRHVGRVPDIPGLPDRRSGARRALRLQRRVPALAVPHHAAGHQRHRALRLRLHRRDDRRDAGGTARSQSRVGARRRRARTPQSLIALRVLFLTHAYPRYAGDIAGGFLHLLATALVRRGHEIRVLAPSEEGLGGTDVLDGIAITRVRYGPPSA